MEARRVDRCVRRELVNPASTVAIVPVLSSALTGKRLAFWAQCYV